MDALARAGSNYSVDGNARICSRHFLSSDFCEINGKRQLKWDAIPSLHLLEQAANGNGVLFPASKAVSSGKKHGRALGHHLLISTRSKAPTASEITAAISTVSQIPHLYCILENVLEPASSTSVMPSVMTYYRSQLKFQQAIN